MGGYRQGEESVQHTGWHNISVKRDAETSFGVGCEGA
jgi:hypothetical protein